MNRNHVTDLLPENTIDLRSELVPAVRGLLGAGLSPGFMASCLRIEGFQPFGGGLKADLVGGLTLSLQTVLKLGTAELDQHRQLMEAVNRLSPRTFPEVLDIVRLGPDRRLMLMEQLRGYETLLQWVYHRPTSRRDLERIVAKTVRSLSNWYRMLPGDHRALPGIVRQQDPYGQRLGDKLKSCIEQDPELAEIYRYPGEVMGREIPPLGELLPCLEEWLGRIMPEISPILVHGDIHLGNIMIRRFGKGLGIRFIDPNPLVGYSDALYDYGKLLHFAEPVGWAHVAPERCRATWEPAVCRGSWKLDAELNGVPEAAERRRHFLARIIRMQIDATEWMRTLEADSRLELARASAHVGMAGILFARGKQPQGRYVLAYVLSALAEWHRRSRK